MDQWNFENWLKAQIGKPFMDVFKSGQEASYHARNRRRELRNKKTGQPRLEAGAAKDFDNRMGQFLFFMPHNSKPDGVTESDWYLYMKFAEACIKNGN
ncbi:MAG: hypothetical protein V3R64_03320 [Sphingomonadales bacterium]